MHISKIFLLLLFIILFIKPTSGQIVFKELKNYQADFNDSLFFDITSKRSIIPLNGNWKVYSNKKEKGGVNVTVPSGFEGDGELLFEKSFQLNSDLIKKSKFEVHFLGLNYHADISLNNDIIYRHTGGVFPFSFELPKDLLKQNGENLISVQLIHKLDSENTIPVKQRFLFPKSLGGIIFDVYIKVLPNILFNDFNISYKIGGQFKSANISLDYKIENKDLRQLPDSLKLSNNFKVAAYFINQNNSTVLNYYEFPADVEPNKEKLYSQKFVIQNPELWTPENPVTYSLKLNLYRGEELIDQTVKQIIFYNLALSDSILLNGNKYLLKGVSYLPSFTEFGSVGSYNNIRRDLTLIKETGFNTVRFAKNIPHPYALKICEEIGLLVFVELPINNIPSSVIESGHFIERIRNFLVQYLKSIKNKTGIAAVGVGSGFANLEDSQFLLLKKLSELIKKETGKIVYASFLGNVEEKIEGIDLYGFEFYNNPVELIKNKIENQINILGKNSVFVSEAIYTSTLGSSNGYSNQFSIEAQAKFFDDFLSFNEDEEMICYFLAPMFSYRGDFASLTGGYNEKFVYPVGILEEEKDLNKLTYKVIYSRLHNLEKVTIPIGSKKDDAPMVFILFGLALAFLTGILVNSGKKFREDASRALLRPYNFFADIRDQRIISGYQSTILVFIVATSMSLLLSNVLYYFKMDLAFEKILLSFGSPSLMKAISYLSWNPTAALFWLSLIYLLKIVAIVALVQIGSLFVRNRVFLVNNFYMVVWSFIPMLLLIPVGLILYRVLNVGIANTYIFAFLGLICMWIFYRLIKGIYVIFDVRPAAVYFYSITFVLVIVVVVLFIFQAQNSVIDYLFHTINNIKYIKGN